MTLRTNLLSNLGGDWVTECAILLTLTNCNNIHGLIYEVLFPNIYSPHKQEGIPFLLLFL